MQKSIYFRRQTKLFEDDLDAKIMDLEKAVTPADPNNKNVQDIVESAAQNMRTTLVVIKAYTNLLMHYEGEEKEDALTHLRQSALKIEGVINRMVTLTHAQHTEIQKGENIRFAVLLEEVKNHLIDDIEVIDPSFEEIFEVDSICYDKFNIFSLVFCILHNSLVYRRKDIPLTIQLHTFQKAEYTVLEITDNGQGFDYQSDREELFKPFSKISVHQSGMGTGLYLTKTIIEKNGGYVEIDSTPNQGTTVRLYLKPTTYIR